MTLHSLCGPWPALPRLTQVRPASKHFPARIVQSQHALMKGHLPAEEMGAWWGVAGPREWCIRYPGAEFEPGQRPPGHADNRPAPDEPREGSSCVGSATVKQQAQKNDPAEQGHWDAPCRGTSSRAPGLHWKHVPSSTGKLALDSTHCVGMRGAKGSC